MKQPCNEPGLPGGARRPGPRRERAPARPGAARPCRLDGRLRRRGGPPGPALGRLRPVRHPSPPPSRPVGAPCARSRARPGAVRRSPRFRRFSAKNGGAGAFVHRRAEAGRGAATGASRVAAPAPPGPARAGPARARRRGNGAVGPRPAPRAPSTAPGARPGARARRRAGRPGGTDRYPPEARPPAPAPRRPRAPFAPPFCRRGAPKQNAGRRVNKRRPGSTATCALDDRPPPARSVRFLLSQG